MPVAHPLQLDVEEILDVCVGPQSRDLVEQPEHRASNWFGIPRL